MKEIQGINKEALLSWIDGLSHFYAKYENQPSNENLSLLLGYISSSSFLMKSSKELETNPHPKG